MEKEIYQITIQVDTSVTPNRTMVSRCEDEWFDIALVLEGLGVLIPMVAKATGKSKEDVVAYVKDYIDKVANDYGETHFEMRHKLPPVK